MVSPAFKGKSRPPKKSVQKRLVFRPSKSRLPLLAFLVLLFYLAVSFTFQFGRLSVLRLEMQNTQKQIAELQSKNTELREQLKQIQSDSYLEQIAREKLGLVKSGEVRIVPLKPTPKE